MQGIIGSVSKKATYALFAIAVLGASIGNLSQTGLNAMLPAAMGSFGVAVDVGQWMTTGYMLMLGLAVPVATYLSQRLSAKSYLILSYALFASGSLMDWLSPDFALMLIGRILQGSAVGLFIPMLQTIAMTRFPKGQQATAMGVAGIALGFAPNVGPTIGGILDSTFGWRSFFFAISIASALLLASTFAFVGKSGPENRSAHFEVVSFACSTLGFGGVLMGLSEASSYGPMSPWVWVPLIVGLVFLALFFVRQKRISDPLMDLRIFKSKRLIEGMVASMFLFACFMGVTLVIPLYVQNVVGGTSFDSGMVLFPMVFTALIVNPVAGWVADRTSIRLVCVISSVFLAAGSVLSATIGQLTPLWLLSVYQCLRGIGVSGLVGPLLTYSLTELKGPLVNHGSSAMVLARQIAATFGTATMVLCVVFGESLVSSCVASPEVPYTMAMAYSAAMAACTLIMCAFFIRRTKKN